MFLYRLGNSDWIIVLTDSVVDHFRRNKQFLLNQKEAGGQLFARFQNNEVWIEEATGPRSTDLRTRYSYRADKKLEQREINNQFEKGLHFVGDWHSHPTKIPEPSGKDLGNIKSCFSKSKHDLVGFILIVIGTAEFPAGIHLSVHNQRSCEILYCSNCI